MNPQESAPPAARVASVVSVSGNPWLTGALASACAAVAVGYGVRAQSSPSPLLASLVALGFILLAGLWALAALDALLPRLVMDRQGVRLRFGRTWVGIPWTDFGELTIRARRGWWRDDLIVPAGADPARLEQLGRWAGWQAAWTRRCFGSAYAVPVGWSTRVQGADGDLLATMIRLQPATEAATLQTQLLQTPLSGADPAAASTRVIAIPGDKDAPRAHPTIGPVLVEARLRLALTVPQLADRARISARDIEAIESDDFETSGGDFYARGQLRTLCRVLGVEVAPLLEAYDSELVGPEPVGHEALAATLSRHQEPSAELRARRWSVGVSAVMVVALGWSMAQLGQQAGPANGQPTSPSAPARP